MRELLLVVLVLLQNFVTAPSSPYHHERLVIKMIHYEAMNSPFYNPELTLEDRVRIMNERSESRISHLITDLEKDGNKFQIYPAYTSQFIVPLKIGTPPVPQILTVDTGSLLLWVHCGFTIGGEDSPAPLYRYAESSSYVEDVYCGTSVCDLMILNGKCGVSTRRCEYTYAYATGMTRGHLASEVVAFELSNGTEVIFKRLIFGCSSIFSKGADNVSGVLGLGQRAVSLVSQQTGFSYCIRNITDIKYDSNALILGGKPIIEGASTPMFMFIGKYYITLEKISVGNKFLDIDPIIFKRIDHQGGMIVYSGATSSYLPEIAYKKLKEEIKSVIGTTLEEFICNRPDELCYYGLVNRDLKGLPTIAYHFSENAKMEFSADNLFRQDSVDHFCLSIQISESRKMPFSILGVWAQQYFYVSFDFNTMRISFTRIDCDRLFD